MIRFVVVEDEVKVLEGVSALVEKLSPLYKVVGKAQNGRDGMALVEASSPDVVITDIKMPGMDGLDMLRALRAGGARCRFIILSGHADFQFAQEAIKLGSVDYLLKPVRVSDLKRTLEGVQEEMSRAGARTVPVLDSYPLSQILYRAASENEPAHALFLDELRRRLGGDHRFAALLLHSDHALPVTDRSVFADVVRGVLGRSRIGTHCIVGFDEANEQLLLLADKAPGALGECVEQVWRQCGDRLGEQTVFCFESFNDAGRFPEVFRELQEVAGWGISFPPGTLLSRALIQETAFQKLEYPLDIESALFQRISSGKLDGVEQDLDRLVRWLQRERYNCVDLRETMLSLLSTLLYAIRKVSYSVYAEISQMEIDDCIRRTNSVEAYANILLNAVNQFRFYNRGLYDCKNPVICNVLRIIEAEYNKNISLEIIAGRLNLTVEYLSTLFKREIGVRFTVFLTQYRIDRAKELMARPNTKIYLVAQQAGYNDTTYFCKVFKRVTGLSPKDYMNSVS